MNPEASVPVPLEDDSTGFDLIEREYIRRHFVPEFEWLSFDEPSPRNRLRVPLREARIGLVATAGAHLPDQRPGGSGGGVWMIPIDAPEVRLTHDGYDTERAMQDPDVVFPVGTLRRLADSGFVGSVAPTVVSTMGYVPDGRRVLQRTLPAARDRLVSEGVDLALLVPA